MGVLKHAVAAMLLLCSNAALAQTVTAYQSGLRIAQGRGYANAGCYAQVFAKHAVVVEKANGRRNWHAASTPAYNAEQRSRCGVDRLADIAVRRQARVSGGNRYAGPRSQGGAYVMGVRIAAQRGYSGERAHCFARVFTSHAVFRPSPLRSGVVDWNAPIGPAMRGEMQSQCGISM
jgi:hypothetical protein